MEQFCAASADPRRRIKSLQSLAGNREENPERESPFGYPNMRAEKQPQTLRADPREPGTGIENRKIFKRERTLE